MTDESGDVPTDAERRPDEFHSGGPAAADPTAKRRWLTFLLGGGLVMLLLGAVFAPQLRSTGRKVMCYREIRMAMESRVAGDWAAALQHADKAVDWRDGEDGDPLYYRGQLRREAPAELRDLQGSLDDFDRLIKLAPHYAPGFTQRARTLQRFDRHQEALDDLTTALELSPEDAHQPWNERAYARAVAGRDLSEALQDVETAIELQRRRHEARGDQAEVLPAYLDTRGYLRHLLGRHEPALEDLNLAIERMTAEFSKWKEQQQVESSQTQLASVSRVEYEHALAVMHYHRALVHEALANASAARADFEKADELGYDPENGVY